MPGRADHRCVPFTAAQAAQKTRRALAAGVDPFTAAQAAQKGRGLGVA